MEEITRSERRMQVEYIDVSVEGVHKVMSTVV